VGAALAVVLCSDSVSEASLPEELLLLSASLPLLLPLAELIRTAKGDGDTTAEGANMKTFKTVPTALELLSLPWDYLIPTTVYADVWFEGE
jgi:hypothetical protein